jgi:hypothetical protein
MKFLNWIRGIRRDVLIKNSFLFPILLVVIMSISHVVSWYNLGNPFAWAIYLSVAIEIFALASVSAASININRASVWFLFSLVTSIQIIGNIFFEFTTIDQNGTLFKSWVELVSPFFSDWTPIDHRRLLAIIQGGTIPMMSLIALNYYIKFGDKIKENQAQIKSEGFWNVPEQVKPEIIEPIVKEDEKKDESKINRTDEDESIAPWAHQH